MIVHCFLSHFDVCILPLCFDCSYTDLEDDVCIEQLSCTKRKLLKIIHFLLFVNGVIVISNNSCRYNVSFILVVMAEKAKRKMMPSAYQYWDTFINY